MKSKTQIVHAVAIAASVMWSTPLLAQRATIYDNGTPNGNAGFDIFNDIRSADDFVFAGTTSFDVIRFWGLLPGGSAYTPRIFWEILSDDGGQPGTSVASGATVATSTFRTALDGVGFDSWQFDLEVGAQTLGSGIYWLALHDGLIGDITDSTLLWETTGNITGNEFAHELIPMQTWSGPMGADLAFELESSAGVIPEPTTIILLGTGLAALLAAARRKQKISLDSSTSS